MTSVLTDLMGFGTLIVWIAFLFEGRSEMRRYERLSYAYVFKWNILPLLIGLDILLTQSLGFFAFGVLAFFLFWPFARFAVAVLPVVAGWHMGTAVLGNWYPPMDHRVLLGAVVAVLVCSVLSQCIVAAMRRPPAHT